MVRQAISPRLAINSLLKVSYLGCDILLQHHRRLLSTRRSISSLGQDEHRELYLVNLEGDVFKIVSGGKD